MQRAQPMHLSTSTVIPYQGLLEAFSCLGEAAARLTPSSPAGTPRARRNELILWRNKRLFMVHLRHMWIVALPAEILLAMRRHIDFRRSFGLGFLAVALCAELSCTGFARSNVTW